jgi:hypothetical protein
VLCPWTYSKLFLLYRKFVFLEERRGVGRFFGNSAIYSQCQQSYQWNLFLLTLSVLFSYTKSLCFHCLLYMLAIIITYITDLLKFMQYNACIQALTKTLTLNIHVLSQYPWLFSYVNSPTNSPSRMAKSFDAAIGHQKHREVKGRVEIKGPFHMWWG